MKLTAKVTALRTNDRAEITIITSKTGLEQVIVVDNEEWALGEELILLVLTQGQAVKVVEGVDIFAPNLPEGFAVTVLLDQLRPDPPPPFMVDSTADTQEFVREVGQ